MYTLAYNRKGEKSHLYHDNFKFQELKTFENEEIYRMSFLPMKSSKTESLRLSPYSTSQSPQVNGKPMQNLQLPPINNGFLLENKALSNPRSLTDDNLREEEITKTANGYYRDEMNRLSPLKEEEIKVVKKVKNRLLGKLKGRKKEKKVDENVLRLRFNDVVDNSKSLLIKACLRAEKMAIDKLEKEALKKKGEIMKKRAIRFKKALELESSSKELDSSSSAGDNWLKVKQQVEEMASLRKIEADLGRARARRKTNIALTIGISSGRLKASDMLNNELRRLEKVEEIHKLVLELKTLDLKDEASELMQALKTKESSEINLRARLYNENLKANLDASRRDDEEIARLRQLIIENRERLERQRILEEKRRRERKMAALRKKARNREFQKYLMESTLNTRKSRSFTYSFLPKLPVNDGLVAASEDINAEFLKQMKLYEEGRENRDKAGTPLS